MFEGNLCHTCFKEENATWFAYREQLRTEIEARTKYLDWMVDKDDNSRKDLAPAELLNGHW